MRVFENAPAEVGVVYTGFWRIEGDKRIYIPSNKISRKEGNIQGELLKGNFVTTQATVLKRSALKKQECSTNVSRALKIGSYLLEFQNTTSLNVLMSL